MSRCQFCAFSRDINSSDAYVLSYQQILDKVKEAKEIGAIRILLQGGLHPHLKLGWYKGLLKLIKSNFDVQIHGFSPPEICHFAKLNSISIQEVLYELKEAGLDSIPGGGAEILVDEIRQKISPYKCSSTEWLEVMKEAHSLKLKTTATMMFGHIESYRDRIEHLQKIRDLQSQTGGFIAFIPWTFQPQNTQLSYIPETDAIDYLKTLAISRIFLDNIPNIQGSWLTQGAKIAQLALHCGANDFGDTVIEENVVSSAIKKNWLTHEQIRHIIQQAGFTPLMRDTFYNIL